jgi:hypothetical protein
MAPGHEADLDPLLDAMRALPDQIDEIAALSVGRLLNESPYEAVLCVDLADEDALQRYREHPAHRPVGARLREVADDVVVADHVL